jgi:hypothetical protein
MYASTIKAQKNGRQLAARRLDAIVLCPISSCVSFPSASRLSSRSPWRRRSWLRTWRVRRGGQAIELRCSSLANFHFASRGKPDAINHIFELQESAAVHRLHSAVAIFFGESAFVASIKSARSLASDCADFIRMAAPHRNHSLFDFRCHFAFSFRPAVGLVLFSETTIPNRLGIVNPQKAKKVRFFNGRNRRQLRRAAARTQNPAGQAAATAKEQA